MAEGASVLKRLAALEFKNEGLRDEVRSLKADKISKEDTINLLEQRIRYLEIDIRSKEESLNVLKQKYPSTEQAVRIGKEVRMRYLEDHRRRMGLKNVQLGLIKAGNRAAHRGRPLVDALLYESGERHDINVYADLYGVEPKFILMFQDVDEIITACGFHGTLKSDGQMQPKFEVAFRGILEDVKNRDDLEVVKVEFEGSSLLSRKYHALEACFDEIISANPPRFRGPLSSTSNSESWN